jgi:hypothetical protein
MLLPYTTTIFYIYYYYFYSKNYRVKDSILNTDAYNQQVRQHKHSTNTAQGNIYDNLRKCQQ